MPTTVLTCTDTELFSHSLGSVLYCTCCWLETCKQDHIDIAAPTQKTQEAACTWVFMLDLASPHLATSWLSFQLSCISGSTPGRIDRNLHIYNVLEHVSNYIKTHIYIYKCLHLHSQRNSASRPHPQLLTCFFFAFFFSCLWSSSSASSSG